MQRISRFALVAVGVDEFNRQFNGGIAENVDLFGGEYDLFGRGNDGDNAGRGDAAVRRRRDHRNARLNGGHFAVFRHGCDVGILGNECGRAHFKIAVGRGQLRRVVYADGQIIGVQLYDGRRRHDAHGRARGKPGARGEANGGFALLQTGNLARGVDGRHIRIVNGVNADAFAVRFGIEVILAVAHPDHQQEGFAGALAEDNIVIGEEQLLRLVPDFDLYRTGSAVAGDSRDGDGAGARGVNAVAVDDRGIFRGTALQNVRSFADIACSVDKFNGELYGRSFNQVDRTCGKYRLARGGNDVYGACGACAALGRHGDDGRAYGNGGDGALFIYSGNFGMIRRKCNVAGFILFKRYLERCGSADAQCKLGAVQIQLRGQTQHVQSRADL